MKNIKNNPIIIPLEFRVACTVTKIEIQQVLQIFIDHILFYDSISNVYSEGYTEATRTTSDYLESKEGKHRTSKSFRKCQDTAINCIKYIQKLIKNAPNEVDANRKKAELPIIKLYNVMERFYTPTNKLYINEFSTIHLSKDFCITCEILACYPNEFLEYFMNNISLAELHAREDLKEYVQNVPLASFLKIVNGFRKDNPQNVTVDQVEIDFYDKAQELRLSLFNIRDVEERIKILKEFYLSHYNYMNP